MERSSFEDVASSVLIERGARQSSTADGRAAIAALSGPQAWSCTRKEHEPWWECYLGDTFELTQIMFRPKVDGKYYAFVSRSPLRRVKIHEAKSLALRYSMFGGDGLVSWEVPPETRASWIRIQAKGVRSLQLSQVAVKRVVMRSCETKRSRLVELKSPDRPHTTAGFYRAQSREIVVRSIQPNNLALSRVNRSKTLRDVTSGLRRSKSCFDGYKVDQLYWRALLRYEKRIGADRKATTILSSFSAHQLEWIRTLFALCRAQSEHQLRSIIPRSLTGDILERVMTKTLDDDNAMTLLESRSFFENETVQARYVYSCLRKVAESLALQEIRSHQRTSTSIDALLATGMDAASTASVAHDLAVLVRIDERDLTLKDFTTIFSVSAEDSSREEISNVDICDADAVNQSLSLQLSFTQFAALFGVVRDRTRGVRIQDDIAHALSLESDEIAIDPFGTQRRQDRRRLERVKTPTSPVDELRAPTSISTLGTSYFKQHPARAKLTTAENKFRRVASALLSHKDDDSTNRQRARDYRANAERRRQHQRELSARARARSPGTETQSHRKTCGLCLAKFHGDSFGATVARDLVIELLAQFGLDTARVEARGGGSSNNSNSSALARLSICTFCAQFFDCESADGLAINKTTRKEHGTALTSCRALEPFFDLRYPSTVDNVQSRALEAHRRNNVSVTNMCRNRQKLTSSNIPCFH